MVERRSELKRRYHRKKKLARLKAKLAATKDGQKKENILRKIHLISPWWAEKGKAAPAAKPAKGPPKAAEKPAT